jgi:hypothetical protein
MLPVAQNVRVIKLIQLGNKARDFAATNIQPCDDSVACFNHDALYPDS